MRFNYRWRLADTEFTKDNGAVFSCFAGGGGSTLGYKLAGYDVIGCNEIDPKMLAVYKLNNDPEYAYMEDIREFKNRKDLPDKLFNLNILDGSFPCSSFSMSGTREKDWGKEKKFKEGQKAQVLDTLAFDFIDLAERLQPKVVVSENVKGLLLGNAKMYVSRILKAFDKAGYYCLLTLLDASTMGVPQRRERVFFTALRKDLLSDSIAASGFIRKPALDLSCYEKPVTFGEIRNSLDRVALTDYQREYWEWCVSNNEVDFAKYAERRYGKRKNFSHQVQYDHDIPHTITGTAAMCVSDTPHYLNDTELVEISSFPLDFDFGGMKVDYVVGMSVPPVMLAQVATRIWEQWLSKLA